MSPASSRLGQRQTGKNLAPSTSSSRRGANCRLREASRLSATAGEMICPYRPCCRSASLTSECSFVRIPAWRGPHPEAQFHQKNLEAQFQQADSKELPRYTLALGATRKRR